MSTSVEQIKERLSIVELVASYIKLEKAGSNYRAKCPFHNEKTPSFFVSPSRNSYYCFGCGAKGDAFTFVEAFEGLDFLGALRLLGERTGVKVAPEKKEVRDERTKLLGLLEEATHFFEEELRKHPGALSYLTGRGVLEKTIKHFRLGYAPSGWHAILNYLKQKKYTDGDIEKAGLVKKAEERYYDRFRGRIMFPIFDSSGRAIAFSGRLYPEEGEEAKYVNSPETPLYNKSAVLYGYDKAKHTIRKFNFSIIVEGQVDLLMSHQTGFMNTVALSGTALSETQIEMLRRLSSNIVFALDADRAGEESTAKSAIIALSLGMDVKVASLPPRVDPADLAKKGPEHLRKTIRESKHIIEYRLDMCLERYQDRRVLGKKIKEDVVPFMARITSKIDQAHFVGLVSRRLGMSEDVLWEEIATAPRGKTKQFSQTFLEKKEPKKQLERLEVIMRKLTSILLWQEGVTDPAVEVKKLRKRFQDIVGKKYCDSFIANISHEHDELVFMAEASYDTLQNLEQEVQELFYNLEKEFVKTQYEDALHDLRQAERTHDEKKISATLDLCKVLSTRLHELK